MVTVKDIVCSFLQDDRRLSVLSRSLRPESESCRRRWCRIWPVGKVRFVLAVWLLMWMLKSGGAAPVIALILVWLLGRVRTGCLTNFMKVVHYCTSSVLSLKRPTPSEGRSSMQVLASSVIPADWSQACCLRVMADAIDLEAASAMWREAIHWCGGLEMCIEGTCLSVLRAAWRIRRTLFQSCLW